MFGTHVPKHVVGDDLGHPLNAQICSRRRHDLAPRRRQMWATTWPHDKLHQHVLWGEGGAGTWHNAKSCQDGRTWPRTVWFQHVASSTSSRNAFSMWAGSEPAPPHGPNSSPLDRPPPPTHVTLRRNPKPSAPQGPSKFRLTRDGLYVMIMKKTSGRSM